MGFLKGRLHRKPDIASLLRRQDLDGLVRALGDELPEVASDAAAAFRSCLDDPVRAESAATALSYAGQGLPLLREYLLDPDRLAADRPRGAAGTALMRAWIGGGIHAAAARAILNEVDAAEPETQRHQAELLAETERWQARVRETEEQRRRAEEHWPTGAKRGEELEAREAARRPLAAKLAALLGNPGWMVDGWTIKPGPTAEAYRGALAKCRRLGLPVTEHEKVAETAYHQTVESAHLWANVEFEGESFEIDGGDQMYFGNEW